MDSNQEVLQDRAGKMPFLANLSIQAIVLCECMDGRLCSRLANVLDRDSTCQRSGSSFSPSRMSMQSFRTLLFGQCVADVNAVQDPVGSDGALLHCLAFICSTEPHKELIDHLVVFGTIYMEAQRSLGV